MLDASSVLALVAAYLLGAVPFGLLVARRVAGVDVRAAGSGNIGATNVARAAGKRWGVVTLALDALKGAVPVLLAERWLQAPGPVVAGVGLAAVVGHVFPVYLRFAGGKGVATALGVFAALSPLPTLVALAVFAALFAVVRRVSAGSLLASLALVAATALLDGRGEVVALASLVAALVWWRHRDNLRRLLAGTERGL